MGLVRNRQTANVLRADRKFLGRTSPPRDTQIVAAEGSRVRDARGRSYIDFQMGWCVGNLGWNPPEIVSRLHAFDGPSYVPLDMAYAPWAELAERLVSMAPGELARAFRAVTGTEAVELAIQLAVQHTGRKKLISIEHAYHGNSFAARSLGEPLRLELPNVLHLAPPLDLEHQALDRLEKMLQGRDVAAFVMEPTITNLAVTIPDGAFMRDVVPLCHFYGTLVIMDEVACGLGRTGKLFACDHYGISPDLVTLAKSLGGGLAPIATTLAIEEVAAAGPELEHYSTFGWQPLPVEAALATLDFWEAHGDNVFANIEARSRQIRRRLESLFPDAELRVQGLAIAIDLEPERVAHVDERCREHGLLLYAEDGSLVMFPALTIDEATADEALAMLESAARPEA
jgi:acetylornithine/succinyldiaminopimelate/putrescine aminotransferase